ncbi:MAG TPA: alpha-amylase family protein [Planctomycetota bacterium]|nr:alpha-amylase family protein [Planctomycetota bacterium]
MRRPHKSAEWVFQEGIRVFGMWEPLHFERMRGNVGDNQKLVYDFKRSRTFLQHLARRGVNQVWFNWWKGYGLEHERECQDQVARLFPVCRELGLRAVCYHSFGSLTFDTLLAEEPDAVNWITRTQAGQPTSCQVTYQCFRHRPCFSSEGYLAYMEKVLARAIDAGADGIHFDNIGMQSEPEACHCERCTRLFREYLQEQFGGDLGEELFGMRDFAHATVPWFNQHNPANNFWRAMGSYHRAWIDFKCHTLGRAAQRLADFVHERNPNCFVEMNAYEGDGFASAFWRGIDYDQVLPKLELVCDERSPGIGLNAKGAITGPYRGKKWCRAFGCAHWAKGDVADFCEDLALSSAPYPFWRKYKQYQLRAVSRARVAVLRERHSLAYNRFTPWEETLAVEQYLIERRIPFDLAHNGQLSALAGTYDLLVVAGAEVMADEVRDEIVRFVRGGGRLLLVGASGVHDRYYRIRRQRVAAIRTMRDYARALKPLNAFHELVGPDPLGSGKAVIRRTCGKGRVAWLRAMDVDRLPHTPEHWTIGDQWFMLPRNATEIDAALAWLVPQGFGIQVETHGKLYVHFAEREDTGEWLVHLINHEHPHKTARADVRLDVTRKPAAVASISIDDAAEGYPERKERFQLAGATLTVPVEDIRAHRTVIVRF